jgi:hypothetical protein
LTTFQKAFNLNPLEVTVVSNSIEFLANNKKIKKLSKYTKYLKPAVTWVLKKL